MKNIAFVNLGCSKNIVDGEKMAAHVAQSGYGLTDDYEQAEIIVVNTCAFIKEATQEAIDTILEMARFKEMGCCRQLLVAGCFSERYKKKAQRQLPEVDGWIGVHSWAQDLEKLLGAKGEVGFARELTMPHATQYLKIAEGCSHGCSFCVIPSIRGPYRSRPSEEIIQEAQWLEAKGAAECILVSQDTSWYGRDRSDSLEALLERLLRETSFPWIRMLYLHPNWITDSLLRLVAGEERLCSYFDIPLQHCADAIIKNMHRRPLESDIRKLVEKIRQVAPRAAIRTSFILGFPGEKESHFQKLLHFMEWARFEKVGVFPYSPEEGTEAAKMRSRPRMITAQRRCETVMALQREISREIQESYIGKTLPVIIDGVSENPDYNFEGRTQRDAPEVDGRVFVLEGDYSPGDIARLKIIDADDYDFFVC